MTLSLRLIQQAVVLGGTGNFARAAERLGITQPTLTRNIAALEADLGMRLFDRGRGGAAPTVFGQTVIERGALLRDADALRAELKALAGLDTGQLSIAAGPMWPMIWSARPWRGWSTCAPGCGCASPWSRPESIQEEVLSGRHELGMCGIESQPPHDELSIVPMRERRLFLTCRAGHPLAGSRPTLQQVLSYPLVTVFMRGPKARGAFLGDGSAGAGRPVAQGLCAGHRGEFDRHRQAGGPQQRRALSRQQADGGLRSWRAASWSAWTTTRRSCARARRWCACATARPRPSR